MPRTEATIPSKTVPNDPPPLGETAPSTGQHSLRWGLLAGTLAFLVLILTEPMLAIAWDEGYSLGRERRIRAWLSALVDPEGFAETWSPPALELVQPDGPPPKGRLPVVPPSPEQLDTRGKLFDSEVIAYFWPFAREEPHGHPPFYAILGLIGDVLTPWRGDLAQARLGPMLLISLAVGALFTFIDRRLGRWAAVVGASALVLQPRLFGHAHYAAYDAPLTALWVLAVLAFFQATEDRSRRNPSWRWAVVLGLVIGAASATKLTGWFIPLPLLAWTIVFRDRRGLLALLAACPVALMTIYALIPPWWHDPIDGFTRFLASNTGRGQTIPIRVMYLGKIYRTPVDSLPIDNTIVWTAMVAPVGFLLLALTGAIRSAVSHSTERFGVLVSLNWLFLLALRAMPNVPGHDGIRLFLPAFGMLAIAAGIGTALIVGWLGRWGKGLAAAAVLEGVVSVAVMMPVPLSYYSPAVGGLPGAVRLGMEPTYYWDALTDDVLEWIDANTPEGRRVATATFPTSFLELNDSGRLRTPISPLAPEPPAWYVVQNRPGAIGVLEYRLLSNHEPVYVSEKFGVPLIWIFSYDDVETIRAEWASQPMMRGAIVP
ncbi:glycosyltransferase family 39 protein [Tautonia rosea]|uniref:glycosyltransferase family 39 protein n=1 Tax=Tautonia rosea TaxID=2728037 RepID=UPI0014745DA6|nr:glycosyltransferase family 39 protein [Tautonia rosea]